MKESNIIRGSSNILKFLAFNRFVGKEYSADLPAQNPSSNPGPLNISDRKLFSLLRNLHEQQIRFLVCGGVAAAFYGHIHRATKVDLWLASERDNYEKLYALLNIDKENTSFISMAPVDAMIGENFSLSIALDLCYFKARDFDGYYLKSKQAILDNLSIPILGLDHLIIEKMASGKVEEETAIKALTRIQKLLLP